MRNATRWVDALPKPCGRRSEPRLEPRAHSWGLSRGHEIESAVGNFRRCGASALCVLRPEVVAFTTVAGIGCQRGKSFDGRIGENSIRYFVGRVVTGAGNSI